MPRPELQNPFRLGPEAKTVEQPIQESEHAVSYLGVALEKAKNRESGFVPKRETYDDFINDTFSLELQKKIAVGFLQGDPLLIEGGTSIGKTTTVRKMCAELGWEVHYANLNGATDVEDLMGRYIPNAHRTSPKDPEYVFADGKVTSGLRQEEGKTKVVILDELNAVSPNILIRLHEVLDALEREGTVVLSEDASEAVPVSHGKTKVIALMNPPGKGFAGREPLDPAQLRRWVYHKEVTDLPAKTFSMSADALFGLGSKTEAMPRKAALISREAALLPEQLAEIPGIADILAKYKEFHAAAKQLIKNRTVAGDQPQPFTFDDRMEPRRVRDFVLQFYSGDITASFQEALRYFYVNKLERAEDREKLEQLINHVAYVPKTESKRKGLEVESSAPPAKPEILSGWGLIRGPAVEPKLEGSLREQLDQARKIMGKDFLGPDAVKETFGLGAVRFTKIPFSRADLEHAKRIGQYLIFREAMTMKRMEEYVSEKFKEGEKVLYDPSWYKDEDFFRSASSTPGWALVAKENIPLSLNKNYLQQTEEMVAYLKITVDPGFVPEPYISAIKQFEAKKKGIEELMSKDWKKAAEELSNLEITLLTRQTAADVLFDSLVYFQTNKERLHPNEYTWTRSRGSDGILVYVGLFKPGGVCVNRSGPDYANDSLGFSFSRSL